MMCACGTPSCKCSVGRAPGIGAPHFHRGETMSVDFLGSNRTGAGGQPLPFSPAVRAGPFVFVSGQVAMGDNGEIVPGGIEAQTRQTLANVEKALALAGCTRD